MPIGRRRPTQGLDILERIRGRRQRFASSGRVLAVKMLWACGPQWTVLVGAVALADAVLPNVAAIALGRGVGQIPAAVRSGIHSSAGDQLLRTLAVAIALYTASLLVDPVGSALNSIVSVKIDQAHKRRLMAAVSGPVGIAHLEDPEVISELQAAQGTFMTFSPTSAPLTFASSIGSRLGGLLACVVIAEFRWWLGLGMLLVWLAIRPPLRRVVLKQIRAFRGEIQQMRRAWYFLGLANRATFAKEVRIFGLAAWVIQGYRDHWHDGMASSWRGVGLLYRRVALLLTVVLATFSVACAVIAWAAYHHDATLTQVATVLPLLPTTMAAGSISFTDISLEWMVSALPDLRALEKSLASTSVELTGQRQATGLPQREIRFEQVAFRYPRTSVDVLTGLNLELPLGCSTALVGVNGAGKTTLVKLLCRLHDPTGGRICLDGIPLNEFDPEAWRRQVAVVFQDFNHYPTSAGDNIAMGAIEHLKDHDGLGRAAARADAQQFIEELPLGWDTVLSRQYTNGTDLSGGQWQRVALARALFAVEHGARLLILDEPTSMLDVRAEAAFFDRFLSITQGVTSLIISHRFSTVRRADRIVVIEGGRLEEQGSHDDLLAMGGTYATMFRTQAASFTTAGREGS
jgi:ATP-binding cassette, subfamily B, bacterial